MADPKYRVIADDLRRGIETGELEPGARLPSEPELRKSYDASRNTIRDAIKWLTMRDLVETRPGQGTFVVTRIVPFMNVIGSGTDGEEPAFLDRATAEFRQPEYSIPRVEVGPASDTVASELRLQRDSEVAVRNLERFIDGQPWSLQTSFYPMSLVEQGATRLIQPRILAEGVLGYLHDALSLQQAGWSDKLTVRVPNDFEVRFFAIPGDGRVPVVDITQTGYDQFGTPFRVTVTTYPADRNYFQRTAGMVPADV